MQLMASKTLAAFRPEPPNLADNKRTKNDHGDKINQQQACQNFGVVIKTVDAGQAVGGDRPHAKGEQDRQIGKIILAPPAPRRYFCALDTHRPALMWRSRIFLRRVLRFIPRMSAART